MTPEIIKVLEENNYFSPKEDSNGHVHALSRFIFTVAIVCNITEYSYTHRYCYENLLDAQSAFDDWEQKGFAGEPSGYIKRKG